MWLAELVKESVVSVCRFMIGSSDSDSDDDKRVVRSAKDRRFDELKATCEEMRVSSFMGISGTRTLPSYLQLVEPCPDACIRSVEESQAKVISSITIARSSAEIGVNECVFVAEQAEHQ